MTHEQESLVERMRRQRNNHLHHVFEYLAAIDPEFLEAYNDIAVLNFNYAEAAEGRSLDVRTKELIAIALLAAVRGGTLRQHIRRAFSLGVSRRDVVEALEMAMHISGAPSLEYGLTEMMALDAEK